MNFTDRHIGTTNNERKEMLSAVGVNSIDELINKTVPQQIRIQKEIAVSEGLSEQAYLEHLQALADENKVFKNYIGLGYCETIVPSVVLRNVLENPGWYTAYTPYQAEISQGRLEALLNFQTMVTELTGMELANASLLDEGTAAAESMLMFFNSRSRADVKAGKNDFFVSEFIFPQTKSVLNGRAENLGINLTYGDPSQFDFNSKYFGAIIQYPDGLGRLENMSNFIEKSKENGIKVAVASDLLALTVLTPPGQWGADVVFGSAQRFGVPMGYGGPHAAFFATKEEFKRNIPGRIIGISQDKDGNSALRMALQTREQHIKRDKATSNICTAQALLAVMASFYAAYHGPTGLKQIAITAHKKALFVADQLSEFGFEIVSGSFFDTVCIKSTDAQIKSLAEAANINLNYSTDGMITIAIGESINDADLVALVNVFAKASGKSEINTADWNSKKCPLSSDLHRKDKILTHPVFNSHHSETQMMRYMKHLENKDISLVHSMIPLGSCTMKLNAASELIPITWPEFSKIHPFAPVDQTQGYQKMLAELSKDLCTITGFAGMSLQPNSGAQGEYAGLAVIRAYHEANGNHNRNIVLIPASAHGTNPASAVVAGMKVVVVKCDEQGNIDVPDLKEKAELHSENLSALMVTYPSTHGVYEESIIEITSIIHDNGGQVYMDGANMNAQVGLTNPGNIGADVCHLNLHKTFAIPHGGGGPGMGPIGVAAHLKPFLPSNPIIEMGGEKAIDAISAAPWGSALILLISYGYIKMLGKEGLKASTENAILNANYLKAKLENEFDILYSGENGTVAHEMIVDFRGFKKSAGVEVEDVAKRLIDYGFHAPTVSFPVAGTLMIEPTESEDKAELDRFCDALLSIKSEIIAIENGTADQANNVLKNAPHTAKCIISDNWDYPYTREQAAYPLEYLRDNKFWVSVRRVDNAYGDRNLICSCLPMESYMDEVEMA